MTDLAVEYVGGALIGAGIDAYKAIKAGGKAADEIADATNVVVNNVFDRTSTQAHLIENLGANVKANPLRQEYEQKVADLSSYAAQINPNMSPDELRILAEEANQARRQLGVDYKNLTPEPLRDYIYEVNLARYGDPLGPSVDSLLQAGKTYSQIIESAARPNPDVNKLLEGFEKWLSQKPDEYVKKYEKFLKEKK